MYSFRTTKQFDRDINKMRKLHRDLTKMDKALDALTSNDIDLLAGHYRDHKLTGALQGYRELHIEGDWLLVYKKIKETITIVLTRTGTHDTLL